MHTIRSAVIGLLLLSVATELSAAESLPSYKPVSSLSGTVVTVGSRSGSEVIAKWGEAFMKLYPNVKVDVQGTGSGTAFPALITDKADMAPMSRPMSAGMIDEFTKAKGYPPLEMRIGIGGVVVFVHPSNPMTGVTRAQLDGMYSNTYFVSEKAILSWGDAGLSGEWATRPVALYSVPERSGAWGLFRAETSTMSAYFKPSIQIRETAAEVVDAVAADPNGIGFAPAGFISDKVKVLPVKSGVDAGATLAGYAKNDEARRRANEFVPPTAAFFESEVYPLTRYFRMYVDQKPGQAMDPAMREFLKFGLSREGQAMMEAAGYLPVPPRVAAEQVAKLK